MTVLVIEPPPPIVTPADIPGDHAGDDAFVTGMIAAAQAEIDGRTGWLGRSLGMQTLELHSVVWPSRLPYRPIVGVLAVEADGVPVDGVTSDRDGNLTVPETIRDPRVGVRIRYKAGYDGRSHDEGGTGDVPANAKAAIILAVQHLKATGGANLFIRSENFDGVGERQWTVSEAAGKVIERAVGNLLAPLRVYI